MHPAYVCLNPMRSVQSFPCCFSISTHHALMALLETYFSGKPEQLSPKICQEQSLQQIFRRGDCPVLRPGEALLVMSTPLNQITAKKTQHTLAQSAFICT
jgi:hypothetical protein